MKLYLSSYRIPTPTDLVALVDKAPTATKVGIITNAKDYYASRARAVKVQAITDYLAALGYEATEVDLRRHRDPEELQAVLSELDMIFVAGGNSFCLRYEMQQSGFETIIGAVLASGVVYVGESAGAAVAGTTLEGINLADEPAFAEAEIVDGLELVPYFILPHVGSAGFGGAIEEIEALHYGNPALLKLTDNQALVVHDEAYAVVQATPEVDEVA